MLLPLSSLALALSLLGTDPVAEDATQQTGTTPAPAPADATAVGQPTASATPDMRVFWNGNLRFQSADKAFEYRLGGRIHLDATYAKADDEVSDAVGDASNQGEADRVGFRRARLQFEGVLWENIAFRTQYDFSGNNANFRDVYVQLRDLVGGTTLWLGQFREPFGLDQLNSSNDNAFLERSLVDVLSPARRTGIALSGAAIEDKLNWMVGAFHANSNPNNGNGTGDGATAITGRIAFAPLLEDKGTKALHLGVAASHRSQDDTAITVQRPEFDSAGPSWADLGLGKGNVTLIGGEAAMIHGPFALQGEYVQAEIDPDAGDDASPSGFYAQAAWCLTGEGRRYAGGSIQRPKPTDPWTGPGTGCGAWEVATRYSQLDLDEDGSDTELSAITVGLNWFANDALALRTNYVFADFDEFDGDAHAIAFRVQLVF